jgi:FHA domain
MMKCSECGLENIDGLDYCDGCGAKLAAGGGPVTIAPAPAATTAAEVEFAVNTSVPAEISHTEVNGVSTIAAEESAALAEAPAASRAPTGEIRSSEPTPPPVFDKPAVGTHFRAKLSLIRGGRKGQEFPLEDGKNLIGRWDPETGSFPEVDLEQDDPEAKISRKHAMIIIENGHITVEDIGSLNGTYVNRGNRLIPGSPQEVISGDELIIGKTFLKLVIDPIS